MQEHAEALHAAPQRLDTRLWGRWTLATALGELVGFSVPTLIGVVAVWALSGMQNLLMDILQVGIMVLAGSAEGAILGLAQWLVLRQVVPQIRGREWVVATMLGGIFAWFLGGSLGTFVDASGIAPSILMSGAIVLVVILGTMIGVAQWMVLRHHLVHAIWWIPANAVAWSVGLIAGFGGPALIDENTRAVVAIMIGVASGVVMGMLSGALTGLALVWLLRRNPHLINTESHG